MNVPFWVFKGGPNDHITKFVGGKEKREGAGLVVVGGPRTTITRIPLTNRPVHFAFTEFSKDQQAVFLQGQILVRLNTFTVKRRYDFSINPRTGDYATLDPEKLEDEVTHALQKLVRKEVEKSTLQETLTNKTALQENIASAVKANAAGWIELGIEVAALYIADVAPANKKLAEAFEAEAREIMLARADRALHDRRMNATENDRRLKEYEAETELELERERTELIAVQSANRLKEAETEAEATRKGLEPYETMDTNLVWALGVLQKGLGPVTITPEVMVSLMKAVQGGTTT